VAPVSFAPRRKKKSASRLGIHGASHHRHCRVSRSASGADAAGLARAARRETGRGALQAPVRGPLRRKLRPPGLRLRQGAGHPGLVSAVLDALGRDRAHAAGLHLPGRGLCAWPGQGEAQAPVPGRHKDLGARTSHRQRRPRIDHPVRLVPGLCRVRPHHPQAPHGDRARHGAGDRTAVKRRHRRGPRSRALPRLPVLAAPAPDRDVAIAATMERDGSPGIFCTAKYSIFCHKTPSRVLASSGAQRPWPTNLP
jgi:hypothetical protein